MSASGRQMLSRQKGFLLAESVLGMAVATVIAVGSASFFMISMKSYYEIRERNEATHEVERGLRRMQRDIRRAAPRSIRADSLALELLHIADAGRYRSGAGTGPSGVDYSAKSLTIGSAANSFNLTGSLNDISSSNLVDYRLLVFPVSSDSLYQSLAAGAGLGPVTAKQTITRVANEEDELTLASTHVFSEGSLQNRIYLVDTAVQYRCDLAAGELIRYSNYDPDETITTPTVGDASVLIEHVTSCEFNVLNHDVSQHFSQVSVTVTTQHHGGTEMRLALLTHVVNQR